MRPHWSLRKIAGWGAVVIGLLTLVDWTGVLVGGLRDNLESALSVQSGQPVTLRKVTGGVWGRIVLHDLKTVIPDQVSVAIDRAAIRMSPVMLLKNRTHPENAIRFVTLYHPVVTRFKKAGQKGQEGQKGQKGKEVETNRVVNPQSAPKGTPDPNKPLWGAIPNPQSQNQTLAQIVKMMPGIRVRNGEFREEGQSASLKSIYVSVSVESGTFVWHGYLKGPGYSSGVLQMSGRFHPQSGHVEFEGRSGGVDLATYADWFRTLEDVPLQNVAGRLKGEAKYQGPFPIRQSGWQGQLEWRDGEVVIKQVGMRIKAREVKVDLKADRAEVSLAAGTVVHPLVGKASWESHLIVEAEQITLDRMKVFSATSALEVRGTMKKGVKGSMEGVYTDMVDHQAYQFTSQWNDQTAKIWTKNPTGAFVLDAQATFGKSSSQFLAQLKGSKVETWLGFSRLEAKGSWSHELLRLASLTGEQNGRAVLSGWAQIPLTGSVSPQGWIKGEGIELRRLPKVKDLGQAGRLSLALALAGSREQPILRVTASIKSVTDPSSFLKGAAVQAEISQEALRIHKVALGDGRVSVSGAVRDPWGLAGERKGEGVILVKRWTTPWMDLRDTAIPWQMEQGRFTWLESEIHTTHGVYRMDGDLQLTGEPSGSFRIAMDRAWGKKSQLKGSHDVKYRITSTPFAVEADLTSLVALDGKPFPPFHVSAAVFEKGVNISHLSWGTFVKGTAELEFHDKGRTRAAIDVNAFPLTMLHVLTGDSDTMGGRVNGKIRVNGVKPLPEIDADLTLNEGAIGGVPLGESTVRVTKSAGEAYTVEMRGAKGHQTFSSYGTVSWPPSKERSGGPVRTAPPGAGVKKEPLVNRTKIDINWSCTNQPIAEWLNMLFGSGSAMEISGMMGGRGRVYGWLSDPTVQGNVTLQHGLAFGNPFEVISGSMDVSRQEIRVTEAKWQSQLDHIGIRGLRVAWQEGRTTWACDDIRFDPYNLWAFRLVGSLALSGQTSKDGAWTTRVDSRDLLLNGYPYGAINWQVGYFPRQEEFRVDEIATQPVSLSLTSKSAETHVVVHVHKDHVMLKPSTVRLPKGYISAQGRVTPQKGPTTNNLTSPYGTPQPIGVVIKGHGVEAAFIVRALAVAVDGEGSADFEVAVTGDLGNPKVNGSLHIKDGRFELWPFQDLKGQMSIEDHWMYLKPWVMSREGQFKVTVNGKVPILLPSKEMSLDVEIEDETVSALMPLGWFKSLEGKLRGHLYFAGTPGHPVWSGKLGLEGGIIRPKAFIEEIRDARGIFTIQKNHGVFEEMSGTIEGIPISVKGSVHFNDYDPSLLDIFMSTKGQTVVVNIPGIMEPGSRGLMVIGGLTDEWFAIKGRRDRPLYQGKVIFQDARFTWPPKYFEGESSAAAAGSSGKVAVVDANKYDFIKEYYWDVLFEVGDRLVYFNDFATITLRQGDQLAYAGLGRRINISGTLRTERGSFDYFGHNFNIVSGEGVWTGDGTTVHLSAKAETEYQGYKFTARVTGKEQEKGTLEELIIRLESDPYLSQQQIASMLTVGMDTTSMTDQQVNDRFQRQLQDMIARTTVRYGARGVISTFQNWTGFELSLDPGAQDPGYRGAPNPGGPLSSWEVGVGRYVTNRWRVGVNFLNYSSLGQTQDWRQQLQMDYRLMGQDYLRIFMDRENSKLLYERRIPF